MIFNSIDETCEYINTLLSKDIAISEKSIKKICELNNISIKKQEYIQGDSYSLKVDSIALKDGELEVVYQKQSWLKHIPSLYHENDFLKRFLAGFQQTHQVIETKIDNISDQFRAEKTEYIDWLASWLGVSISNSVDDTAKRRLVSDMVRLYSIRGTKRYFIDIIKHLTSVDVRIENIVEYKTLHHNLLKKDFRKKRVKVFIDKKISKSKQIEEQKLYFIQMILEHEKPIGLEYEIIYEFKNEPIISNKIDNDKQVRVVEKTQEFEPVTEKIEELKEEFFKGLEQEPLIDEVEEQEIKTETIKEEEPLVKEEKVEVKQEQTKKEEKKDNEKLFKIDNEVDDYSYDNLE